MNKAHQAMMTNCQPDMLQAALDLADDKSLAALGIQALLWAQVKQPDKALAVTVTNKTAPTAEEQNGGYWLHYGRYIAFSQRRDYLRAAQELGEAKVYARLLQDDGRLQLLDFELQEVAVQLGMAVPEEIEAQLDEPMNPVRHDWHYADHYVASRMQLGEYRASAQMAPATHGFFYLTRALTGQPFEMSAADGLQYQVSQAWADVWDGMGVRHIQGNMSDVVQTYADLAYAVTLASNTTTAWHVPRVLGNVPPRRADQAAIWAAVQLQAMVRGARPDNMLDLPRVVSEALSRLRDTTDVMALLVRLAPEAVVIVACGPTAHPATLSAAVAFSHPTTTCPIDFLKAGLFVKAWPAIPGRTPNIGAMLYGLHRMIETAGDEQREVSERLWRRSGQELWSFCPPHFRPVVMAAQNHCISDADLTTLEA